MPLIHLNTIQMLILIFILCPFIQVTGALIGRKVPDSKLNAEMFLYRSHKWENNGKFYKKLFVHKWKGLLPDGAKHFKGDFTKKHLLSTNSEYLAKFVRESCRAELVHYLGMLPFVIFFLLVPPLVAGILIIYSVLVNIPCIIAQRYNRPRLIQLYKLTKQREEKTLVQINGEI